MDIKELNKQLEDLKGMSKGMSKNYKELVSKIDKNHLGETKTALNNIDFSNPKSLINAHEIMGKELNKMLNTK